MIIDEGKWLKEEIAWLVQQHDHCVKIRDTWRGYAAEYQVGIDLLEETATALAETRDDPALDSLIQKWTAERKQ